MERGRKIAKDEYGVEIRWVFDFSRNLALPYGVAGAYDPAPAKFTFEFLRLARQHGAIGLGVGGDERGRPAFPFRDVFESAKELGMLCLPHAGETAGAASVWEAIDILQADRIGHGVRAIEDQKLIAELKARKLPLDVSITSNVRLGIFSGVESHVFRQLDRLGLILTLNSDDPAIFGSSLNNEYLLLMEIKGYKRCDVLRIARNAFVVSGAETETRNRLLRFFDNEVTSLI